VEFRLHTPTYDPAKVMNYLILCSSIINYVKEREKTILENPEQCIGLTLYNIVCDVARKTDKTGVISEEMSTYLRRRRDISYKQTQEGNIEGDEDAINFSSYVRWDKVKEAPKPSILKKSKYTANRDRMHAQIEELLKDAPPIDFGGNVGINPNAPVTVAQVEEIQ
jgi:hypothetical protein